MYGAFSGVAVICAAALLAGTAAAGSSTRIAWSGRAPALGTAVVLLVSTFAVRLPGHGTTAAAGLVACALTGALVATRRKVGRVPAEVVGVAVLTLALASLPFAATGRVEVLGQSVSDDLAFHFDWAVALIDHGNANGLSVAGYPLGPHSLASAAGVLTGGDVQGGFLGLLLAVPVLTALTALGALDGVPGRLRVVAAVVVGLPYLAAAYLAEGAFKEPVMGLLALGCVLCVHDLDRRRITAMRAGGELALLSAATLYSFSLSGLAWPALAVGSYLVVTLARSRRVPSREEMRRAVGPLAAAAAGLGLALALEADRVRAFFSSRTGGLTFGGGHGPGGNFVGQISPAEVLGVWPSADFRFQPAAHGFLWRPAVLLAAAAALWGAVRWARRGGPVVPMATAGALVLYLVARETTIPYVSAKALVVAAPLVMLVILGALLGSEPQALRRRLAWGAVAGVLLAGAITSSTMALRAAYVRGDQGARDLRDLRGRVAGTDVLYLGHDVLVGSDLRGARVSSTGGVRKPVTLVPVLPAKTGPAPLPVDFDSVDPATLARFRYVVAPRGALGSAPPRSFRAVYANGTYVLWRRVGRVTPRQVLPNEGGAPGAVLRCGPRNRLPRTARTAVAATRPAPMIRGPGGWRTSAGASARLVGGLSVVPPGGRLHRDLRLRPGSWRLYLQYLSPGALGVAAGGTRAKLPAQMADPATLWPVGSVRASGAIRVSVRALPGNLLSDARVAYVGLLAAAPAGSRSQEMPLRRACGRYVDWVAGR